MHPLAVVAASLLDPGWMAGSEPPRLPDEEAIEVAESAFIAAVSATLDEPELVACAIDTLGSIQCYGLVRGETPGDATVVIQAGWIDDDGEFHSLSEPVAVDDTYAGRSASLDSGVSHRGFSTRPNQGSSEVRGTTASLTGRIPHRR